MTNTERTGWAWGLAAAAALAGAAWLVRRAQRRARVRHKVVLITGGSRGLGLELARQLGARGAKVAICGRDASTLARAVDDLEARGVHVFARTCDVTDRQQVSKFVDEVRTHLGAVDVLINNAGQIDVGPMALFGPEDYESSINIHLRAPLAMMDHVVPEMKARRRGHVVNIASFAGVTAIPHMASYVVGKHALVGLSRAARLELARYGITVTTVLPGLIRTGSHVRARYRGQPRAEYAWFTVGMAVRGFSISAPSAARAICGAIERRQSELVLGLPARLGVWSQLRAPRVTSRVLAEANELLPRPGATEQGIPGALSRSWLTRNMRGLARTEREFNQQRSGESERGTP